MKKELMSRIDQITTELESITKLPETIAIKKGQLMQNTSNTEEQKKSSLIELTKADEEYQEINNKLKIVQQKMMVARENKARSGATLEGLENRKKDLISNIKNDLNIEEKINSNHRSIACVAVDEKIYIFSKNKNLNLKDIANIPKKTYKILT